MNPAAIIPERVDVESLVGRQRQTQRYRPTVIGGEQYGRALDGRPRFTYAEADRMTPHPQIDFGLRILRAPLYRVTWTVEADSPKVGKYVDEQLRNFWDGHLRQITTSTFSYGVSCGELSDRVSRGQIVFDRFDDVHPQDAKPIRFTDGKNKNQWAGVQIKGLTDGKSNAGASDIQAPHAWWFPGEAQFGNYWGVPRLKGAHEPFLEKVGKGGAIASRRLWFKKCAFRGGQIRHPMGRTEYEIQGGGTVSIDNQDLARQIVERYENGGTLALPNDKDEKGEYLWVFEPPGPNGEVGGILEYPKELDKEMLRGLGIPPEIVDAATVGSGYSGRAIPAVVFFTSEDEIASLIAKCADDQVIRPRVALNFGRQQIRRYRIKLASLAQMIEQDPNQAGKMLQEPDSRQAMGSPAMPQQQPAKQGPVQMSHEAAERLLDQFEKVQLAFSEDDHPRNDRGQFVVKSDIDIAKSDPAKAEKLRATVTNPKERKKLDKLLGDSKPKTKAKAKPKKKKRTIQKIAEELYDRGYRLHAGGGHDLKTGQTFYNIEYPNGKIVRASTDEIDAILSNEPRTDPTADNPDPKPKEEDVFNAFAQAHQRLKEKYSRIGGIVEIPELTDEVLREVPGLSKVDFHKYLTDWHLQDKLALQKNNDLNLHPRGKEGVGGSNFFYVHLNNKTQLSWYAAQTRTGTTKAVGTGEDAGKQLYGDNAEAALRQNLSKIDASSAKSVAEPRTEKAPPVTASELSSLSEITPAADKKSWPKISEAFRAVRDAVYVKVVEGGSLASKLAPDIGDTADDYMNLKASIYGDIDAWKQHTGISWGFTMTLVKHAIAGAFAVANKLKKTDAEKVQMSHEDDGLAQAVEILVTALESVHQSLSIKADVDRDELARLLKARMEKRVNAIA